MGWTNVFQGGAWHQVWQPTPLPAAQPRINPNDPVFSPPGGGPPPESGFAPPGWQMQEPPTGQIIEGPGQGENVGSGFQPAPDPARQTRLAQVADLRALYAFLPGELIDLYIDAWVSHGDSELAWGQVRKSPQYKTHFPHMFRPDQTMRFTTELEYMTWFEGQRRNFAEWGINSGLHEDVIVAWLEGDLSVLEANQRLGAVATGVLRQGDAIRQEFARFYGPESGLATADDPSLVSMALKPQLANDLFHGRITAAQISGEAFMRGFDRDRARSEDLVFRGGLDQQSARQLFSQAQQAVPRFGRFAERFNEQTGFGIGQFEEAAVFGDAAERQRMARLSASERSLFSPQAGVRQDDFGASGLTRR